MLAGRERRRRRNLLCIYILPSDPVLAFTFSESPFSHSHPKTLHYPAQRPRIHILKKVHLCIHILRKSRVERQHPLLPHPAFFLFLCSASCTVCRNLGVDISHAVDGKKKKKKNPIGGQRRLYSGQCVVVEVNGEVRKGEFLGCEYEDKGNEREASFQRIREVSTASK